MRLVTPMAAIVAALVSGCMETSAPDATPPILLVAPDVGQGHGVALIRGSRAVVVDAGPPEQASLGKALRENGVERIEWVLLTHPDLDHAGGLDSLGIPVEGLLHGRWSGPDSLSLARFCRNLSGRCREVRSSETVAILGGATLEVLHDGSRGSLEDPNSRSVVAEFSWHGASRFLVSGDLDTLGELALLPWVRRTEVVQLGHHGSRSSAHLSWLGRAAPRYALVQAGADNGFGHPTPQALARVAAVGADLLFPRGRTVTLRWDPQLELVRR